MSDAARETKTITTPSGTEVVLNAYLIGGDIMALERAPLNAGKISSDGKSGEIEMGAGDAYGNRHKVMVDRIIVSIAGKTGSEKMSLLENMRAADYTFVMKEVEAVAQGLTEEKKS